MNDNTILLQSIYNTQFRQRLQGKKCELHPLTGYANIRCIIFSLFILCKLRSPLDTTVAWSCCCLETQLILILRWPQELLHLEDLPFQSEESRLVLCKYLWNAPLRPGCPLRHCSAPASVPCLWNAEPIPRTSTNDSCSHEPKTP